MSTRFFDKAESSMLLLVCIDHDLKNRLHHLIFEEDGTSQSPVSGIISDHDCCLPWEIGPASIDSMVMNTLDLKEWDLSASGRTKCSLLLKMKWTHGFLWLRWWPKSMTSQSNRRCERAKIHAANEDEALRKIPFASLSLGSEGRWETNCSVTIKTGLCVFFTKMFLNFDRGGPCVLSKLWHGNGSNTLAWWPCFLPRIHHGQAILRWVQPMSNGKSYSAECHRPTQEAMSLARQCSLIFGRLCRATWLGERSVFTSM